MCSISGICNFEKKPSTQIVELMTQCLSHRGPDDSGFFQNENISLGHNRLSIIDLRNSKQPMKDDKSKNIIIFNGEIYNFKELKSELQSFGHKFDTEGDTEVILKSYTQWGVECLKKLEGMFVFCIWDEKKNNYLLEKISLEKNHYFIIFQKNMGLCFPLKLDLF